MSKSNQWAVGDEVLCVESNAERAVVAWREYIIDGFTCCPGCGEPSLYLVGHNKTVSTYHSNPGCDYTEHNSRESYKRSRFIRPDLDSLTNYKEQVSVRELAIPKELKNLEPLKNN